MRCTANKRDGSPCTLPAQGSNGLCWAHDPENAEARCKGARKGGKSKPGSELSMLKQKLITLGDDVLAGNVGRGNAAVATTCYGTAIKAVEAEMRVREVIESRLVETQLKVEEQREIVERMESLEAALERVSNRRTAVGLRNQLRRLEHTLWGQRSSFELRDGPTYWYYEDEVWSTVFRHGTASLDADYKGEPRPEPPDVLKAVVNAKDRRAALERLYAPGCTPFYAYDPDALVERGEFVPLSFLTGVEYGEEYFERLAKISGRSASVVS